MVAVSTCWCLLTLDTSRHDTLDWQCPGSSHVDKSDTEDRQSCHDSSTNTRTHTHTHTHTHLYWHTVKMYDIRPGNGAGQFLQPRSPHGAQCRRSVVKYDGGGGQDQLGDQAVVKVVLWSRGGVSTDEARLEQTPYSFQPH